jgi:hypothetical protein
LGLDVRLEELTVHRPLDDPGRGQTVASQGCDEGLAAPMSEGRARLETRSLARPAPKSGHLGGGGRLVDEHEPVWLLTHPRLTEPSPRPTVLRHVGACGFGRPQRFFDRKALDDQEARQRGRMRAYPGCGLQPRRQLRHRDVAALIHPADQQRRMGREFAAARRTPLSLRRKGARLRHPARQTDTRARAYPEPRAAARRDVPDAMSP